MKLIKPSNENWVFLSNTSFQLDVYNQVRVSCGLDYIRCFSWQHFLCWGPTWFARLHFCEYKEKTKLYETVEFKKKNQVLG